LTGEQVTALDMFSQQIPDGVLAGKMFMDARAFDEHPVRPTKLFIGGITRNTSTKMLRDHFSCFGRVLDCVAMRQPDGRPRGFGYVTLDSPAAAAQCLSEHQVIDGRIVDLKPAVAEGTMGMLPPAVNEAPCHMAPNRNFDLTVDHSIEAFLGKPWWATTFHKARGEVADCVDLLSGCATPALQAGPPGTFEDFSFNTAAKHAPGTPAAELSANAPEFVPSNHQPRSKPQRIPELKTGKPTPLSALGERTPFAELTNMDVAHHKICDRKPFGELTNLQSNCDRIKPLKLSVSGPTTIAGAGLFSSTRSLVQRFEMPEVRSEMFVLEDDQFVAEKSLKDAACHRSPINGSRKEDLSGKGGFTVFVDHEQSQDADLSGKGGFTVFVDHEQSQDAASTASPVALRGEEESILEPADQASVSSGDEDTDSDFSDIWSGELPSLGSAKHAAGECKRCNFFAKGRCLNGKDCTFCHLPHEKRKPSRQEKRERREAWLLTQTESSLPEAIAAEMLDRSSHRVILVNPNKHQVHVLPPSISAVQSPSCVTRCPYPLLPPGLAPPLNSFESWQPDAEVSPLAMRSLLMSGSMATAPEPTPLGDSNATLLLSTVPSSAPVPVAALKAAMPGSLSKEPNTRTIGTQTEVELVCPCCGGNSIAKMGDTSSVSCKVRLPLESTDGPSCHVHRGLQWTRGELLSFRDGAEKSASASTPALFQSIPIPVAQP